MAERKKPVEESVFIIGQNIAKIIKEKNLILREVAVDSGMDPENLRKYIKGKQTMGVNIVVRISKALDVQISEIFEGV